LEKYHKAKKIYESVLPPGHPSLALLLVNIANVHSRHNQYETALIHYEAALELQQASLPGDHPDLARTLYNLAKLHDLRGDTEMANNCSQRAKDAIGQTLNAVHPLKAAIAAFVPETAITTRL